MKMMASMRVWSMLLNIFFSSSESPPGITS